ncbi:MAG: hypothetical protein H0V36_11340 [Chloroflexi bacterium]|nr:hypothetical protein [Chloroflexota bacterium]
MVSWILAAMAGSMGRSVAGGPPLPDVGCAATDGREDAVALAVAGLFEELWVGVTDAGGGDAGVGLPTETVVGAAVESTGSVWMRE